MLVSSLINWRKGGKFIGICKLIIKMADVYQNVLKLIKPFRDRLVNAEQLGMLSVELVLKLLHWDHIKQCHPH